MTPQSRDTPSGTSVRGAMSRRLATTSTRHSSNPNGINDPERDQLEGSRTPCLPAEDASAGAKAKKAGDPGRRLQTGLTSTAARVCWSNFGQDENIGQAFGSTNETPKLLMATSV